MELGTGMNVNAGTSFFSALGPVIAPLSVLAAACATVAIGIAIGRYLLQPSDEATVATLTRVRRILVVISFLAALGSIIVWIVNNTATNPIPGLNYIRNWFVG